MSSSRLLKPFRNDSITTVKGLIRQVWKRVNEMSESLFSTVKNLEKPSSADHGSMGEVRGPGVV